MDAFSVGNQLLADSETESVVSHISYSGRGDDGDFFVPPPETGHQFSSGNISDLESVDGTSGIQLHSTSGSVLGDVASSVLDDEYFDEEDSPEHACSYCGIHNTACVAHCVTCNKWFCNSKGAGNGGSHIVNHLVRSKHKLVALHPDSQLGDITLECYNCGNKNIFVLGFISAKAESVVVILCRHPCASASSGSTDWDSSEWQPLIEDRSFLQWVVSATPTEKEQLNARHISNGEMNQLEDRWKTNPEATLRDLEMKPKDTANLAPVKLRYHDGYEYQNCFAPLIEKESECERLQTESQSQSNVTISWDIGLSNQYLATFNLSTSADSSDFRISVGDTMILKFEGFGPTWEGNGIVTRIPGHLSENITVEVKPKNKPPPTEYTTNWSVQFVWHAVTYERMDYALRRFATEDTSVSSYVYHKLMGHDVDDLLLDVKVPENLTAPGISPLNPSQLYAVEQALRMPLSLIQGPPGTGKTVVSTSIVYQLYKLYREPILVCAPSNVAVDQLAERISKSGLSVVRMTAKSRENLDSRVEHLTLHQQVLAAHTGKARGELAKLIALKNELGELDSTDGKIYARLMRQAEKGVLGKAQVICCTCTSSGDARLKNMRFRATLIDESTQATEPQCLIPIVHGCKQVILVGDHKQLGPVVMSRGAAKLGLSQSLFERLVVLRMVPSRLAIQYRMHPCLSLFPSNMFYDGGLQNGVTAEQRVVPGMQFPWPDVTKPMIFWSTLGHEELSGSGTSYLNRSEAANVEKIVTLLFKKGVLPEQIGIVTPYEGQRAYITRSMVSSGSFDAEMYQEVEVESVDAFQGREKDYIVLSCVRSNESQGIGFLGDARRMNVAITRAKYGLIVVGNPRVLSRNPLWSHLLAHFKERRCLLEGSLNALRECSIPLSKPKIPMRLMNQMADDKVRERLSILDGSAIIRNTGPEGGHSGNQYYPPLPYSQGANGAGSTDDTASVTSEIAFRGRGEGLPSMEPHLNLYNITTDWKDVNRVKKSIGDDKPNVGNSMIDRIERLNRSLEQAENDALLDELVEDDDDIVSISTSFASQVGIYD